MSSRLNDFLDQHVLPWPVRLLTHRFVILATIALLIPLLLFADNTLVVLGINSYVNVMSAAVSSIVLLYATIASTHLKHIADFQEQRMQEDHQHIIETHQLALAALANQQAEFNELRALIASSQDQTDMPEPPGAVLHVLPPLGARRFREEHGQEDQAEQQHRNTLLEALRRDLVDQQSDEHAQPMTADRPAIQ